MQLSIAQTADFNWQGHRGCRGLMPENTIPAFLKALDLGVTTLELDVVISKDRRVVVSHEPYFHPDFSIDPNGRPVPRSPKINLYELTYDEIKGYDVGSKGNPDFPQQQKIKVAKPLLSEMIQAVESYRKDKNIPLFWYNIEIKSEESEYDQSQPQPSVFSDLVYAEIIRSLPVDRVIVQSFDFAVLRYWKQQIEAGNYQKVTLAALVSNLKGIDRNLEKLGFLPEVYSPYFQLLTSEKVQMLHDRGMKVIPWTVNTTAEMRRIQNMGVDGIITDYPDRIPR
ncbi:glycerophosphodiester phosphodiesterase [Runella slithyformis]|uniref:Glycerophosphoryl diester phosphodiesterase n=1 Tax=Runella slithyformis (strain ATCC 29530 / DSM 19594 / LMG 11500 / NCIMB 11436 / LSU 4) TaxID=761193 RepID=A0A7U3ZH01_RUNSL|nr:glycerophosphodiester phosphodiesterase [Runella slithyformis]AEI47056.1 glycerophosphoryl diester phosphodiesterase [Runella slithyformis DSM 19594]